MSMPKKQLPLERVKCDRCQLVRINGVICHETGCPNTGARYIGDGEWQHGVDCRECGMWILRGESCDCLERADEMEDEWAYRGEK